MASSPSTATSSRPLPCGWLFLLCLACCLASVSGTAPLLLNSLDASQSWTQSWDGVRSGGVCSAALASAVDPNDGSVVTVGWASGTFLSHPNAGSYDGWATKTSAAGSTLWTRWFSTPQDDRVLGVCIDAVSQIYLSGLTTGFMQGLTNAGYSDHFVVSLDALGNQRWIQQFGSSYSEFAGGCAVDTFGGVYVVGFSNGALFGSVYPFWSAYVVRMSSVSGNMTWRHNANVGKSDQLLYSTTAQVSNCGGFPSGGYQFGVTPTWASLQLPGGRNVVVLPPVAGQSSVPLVVISFFTSDSTSFIDNPVIGAGGYDSVVAAYNGLTGAFLWSSTYASLYDDMALSLTTDSTSSVWVTGYTLANLDGGSYSGTPNSQTDAFLSKLTLNGTKLFTVVYGSASYSEAAYSVATDSAGGVYVTGFTTLAASASPLDGQPNPFANITAAAAGVSTVVGFLSKFDSDGARLWTYLLSSYTPTTQQSNISPLFAPLSVVADQNSGQLYMSGRLEGLWVGQSFPSGTATLSDIMDDQAFLVSIQQPPTNCSIQQFDLLLTQINALLAQL